MARRLLYTFFIRSDRFAGSRISGKEIVMPTIITITVDERGNPIVDKLPTGVFYSRFAAPPDAQIKDVISVNAAGNYMIKIQGPGVSDPWATPPVTLPDKSEATFLVDAGILPVQQQYGTAGCQIGGIEYILGVIVNPSVVLVSATVDQQGTVKVNQAVMPKGVHFKNSDTFSVWTAGGYTMAFSLIPSQGILFQDVIFTKPAPMFSAEISADKLTAWIYDNNLATSGGTTVSFDFIVSDPVNGIWKIIDPTIINNPINQGGSGGNDCEREPRHELVGALAE
jgi:hypothetical protein